jgi:sirohydrochlorin cobaltochelatase
MADPGRLYFVAAEDFSPAYQEAFREFCASLAQYAGEPVELAVVNRARLKDVRGVLRKLGGVRSLEVIAPPAEVSARPMGSAPFLWREDGRPDWAAMWTDFCDLALYGGPPHRGEETALHAPVAPVPLSGDEPMIAEIRRGIWETTGLFAEPAEEPGWVVVTCHSRKMAAWLCASIILENVDARCEEERLFLPASPDFELKDQVKSVITVLAKTNHYWQAHIAAQESAAAD